MARARVSARRVAVYKSRSGRVYTVKLPPPRTRRVRHGGHGHRTVNAPKRW